MMLLNFGQGEAGVGAWPSAKSYPVAEYCTVLSASTPIALDAALTTEAASCADGTDASRRARTSATQQCFTILVPTFAVEIQRVSRTRKPRRFSHVCRQTGRKSRRP